jgi:hypothetical protein
LILVHVNFGFKVKTVKQINVKAILDILEVTLLDLIPNLILESNISVEESSVKWVLKLSISMEFKSQAKLLESLMKSKSHY